MTRNPAARSPWPGVPDTPLVTLMVAGSTGPSDMRLLVAQLLDLVTATGARLVLCDVAGVSKPDAATLDVLARLALTARRLDCRFVLRRPPPRLIELVVLAGLSDVLTDCPDSASDPPRPGPDRRRPGPDRRRPGPDRRC